ncbi:MAG TPA: hypothetical protein VK586_19185 [Streptosporangiaceae bacterium]|nr:hypothetical protein [Streptosporangiaceae bacterium]
MPPSGLSAASAVGQFTTRPSACSSASYGATAGQQPRRALREHSTARAAIEAMLRATADQVTGPDTPHYCMLILAASPAGLDGIARYFTTVVQGLSVQARDGASRADLEAIITCAMAAWDALASADR